MDEEDNTIKLVTKEGKEIEITKNKLNYQTF